VGERRSRKTLRPCTCQFSLPHQRITRRHPRQFDPLIVVRTNDALRLTFPIRDMYLEAIGRAEQTILLTNVSFVPDRWMNRPWYTQLSERLLAPLRFLL
jgi:hypothetical protein